MFEKKKCPNCNEKVKDSFSFCPYCGEEIEESEDWGMLGRNDFEKEKPEIFPNSFLGGITEKMMDNVFKNMLRSIGGSTQVRMSINGKEIPLNSLSQSQKRAKKLKPNKISEENIKKLSKLPRQEPKTSIKRFSDKIIYEIETPGVSSINDIIMIPLENSIEIKAIAKDKVYAKTIPASSPFLGYNLLKGKIIVEFQARN